MDTNVFIAVIFAALLHASWNAMVKKHEDKHVAIAAIFFGHVPASLVIIFFLPAPTIESMPYILASALAHIGYQWFLLSAYRYGDFTKVYPIARGLGPMIVTIVSLLFLGVVLSNYEIMGIFIVSMGIFILSFHDRSELKNKKIVTYSLMTGLFIATYTMIDGYGARISLSPLTYISWSFILNSVIFIFVFKYMNRPYILKEVLKKGKTVFFIGGTISYIVYAIIVWGFTKAPIPMVSALREISIILALLIGTFFLKERFTILKASSVIIIFIGVVFLKYF